MGVVKLLIEDHDVELVIKEFQGQRVVSFRDVDTLHKSATGAARKNFNYNRKRFVEGEDYFVVNCDDAKTLFNLRAPNGTIILTESGYLMLVKSLNDDLAWMVQKQLIKNYFNAKALFTPSVEIVPTQQIPTTIEDILLLAIGSMKDMKKEIAELRTDNRNLSLIVDNEIWITDHQKADIKEAISKRISHLMSKFIDAPFQAVYSSLNTYFNVPKYDKIKRADFELAIDFVNGWYPKKKENTTSL